MRRGTEEKEGVMYEQMDNQARAALTELLEQAKIRPGGLVVVGCSTSEILGGRIGHGSSPEAGEAVARGLLSVLEGRGLFLAAQCCEHLNRALILERAAADRLGYEPVCVRPQPKAGGSFATAVWERLKDPVAVERVRADAGLDIGLTLIGMHLKEVAVPVPLENGRVGQAWWRRPHRPRYIGGPRAEYP